jgi:hypothetical protein
MTRRFFLGAVTAVAAARVCGANDAIPVGIIGLGNRGQDHLQSLANGDSQPLACAGDHLGSRAPARKL